MPETYSPSLPGATNCLLASQTIGYGAIAEDQEDEIEMLETRGNSHDQQDADYLHLPQPSDEGQNLSHKKLAEHLKKASENVVVTSTLVEYGRYFIPILIFLISERCWVPASGNNSNYSVLRLDMYNLLRILRNSVPMSL